MGSKNLKAVVAKNTGQLDLYQPKEFMESVISLKNYLNGSKVVQTLRKVGTPLLYEPSNILGAIRTKNSQETQFKDSLKADEFHKLSKGAMACAACVVHCRHANQQGGEGPEYSAVGTLGSNLGLSSANQIIILNNLCNQLGLDTSSTGSIIAWFIEMNQLGLIDFPELEFGNFGLARSLLFQIAYRQGVGDLMADSSRVLDRLDINRKEAMRIFIGSKGLPQSDPHDCRYIKAFALGIGTASRGADHLRSRPTLEIFDLPDSLTTEIYGKQVDTNPTSYTDKGWIVATHEDIYAVGDGLGICRFITHSFNSPHLLKYHHFEELIKYSTNLEVDDLRSVGQRIVDLERYFNLKCGITRGDDYPPPRYMEEPATGGVARGHWIEPDKYEQMLDEYYQTRKWRPDGQLSDRSRSELEAMIRRSN